MNDLVSVLRVQLLTFTPHFPRIHASEFRPRPWQLAEEDMETMGFECLSLDQDKVALEIARTHEMDYKLLEASTLPAVSTPPLAGLCISFVFWDLAKIGNVGSVACKTCVRYIWMHVIFSFSMRCNVASPQWWTCLWQVLTTSSNHQRSLPEGDVRNHLSVGTGGEAVNALPSKL